MADDEKPIGVAKIKAPKDSQPDDAEKDSAKPNPKASKGSPAPSKDRAKPKRPAGRPPNLETKLREMFEQIGGAVTLINANDGAVITEGAAALASSWAALARENASVARFLEKMTTGGAIGGVIMSTGSIVFALLVNHDMIPQLGGFGFKPEPGDEIPPYQPPPPPQNANPQPSARPPGMGPATPSL